VAQPQVRHLHRGGPVAGVQSARPLFLRGGPIAQVQATTRCVSVATAQEPPRAPTFLFRGGTVDQPQAAGAHFSSWRACGGGPVDGATLLSWQACCSGSTSTRCVSVATAQEPPRAPIPLPRAVRWLSFRRRAHIFIVAALWPGSRRRARSCFVADLSRRSSRRIPSDDDDFTDLVLCTFSGLGGAQIWGNG